MFEVGHGKWLTLPEKRDFGTAAEIPDQARWFPLLEEVVDEVRYRPSQVQRAVEAICRIIIGYLIPKKLSNCWPVFCGIWRQIGLRRGVPVKTEAAM